MTMTYLLGFWFQVSVAPDIGMIGQGEIVSKVDNLYTRFQVSGFSRQGQGEIVSKDNNLYTRFQVSVDKDKEKLFPKMIPYLLGFRFQVSAHRHRTRRNVFIRQ